MKPLIASIRWRLFSAARALGYSSPPCVHGVTVPLNLLPVAGILRRLDGGLYEAKEAYLIRKWLPVGAAVLELGASLGVISSVILQKNPSRLVSVEAIPNLAACAIGVVRHNHPQARWELLETAIEYGASEVSFEVSSDSSAVGKVSGSSDHTKTIRVRAMTLSEIHTAKDIAPDSWLVCDIEGMEAKLPLLDAAALSKHAGIILETHDTEVGGKKYSHAEVLDLFVNAGFELRDRRGRVAVLTRRPSTPT